MNGDVLFEQAENRMTMAAGSDPQPVESSVVPDHSNPRLVLASSLTRLSGGRNHIPYPDHNYGKPLTPPDSCSPEHPEEADTGNEEEGFTRCICGFKHDDGYMICCDRCSAWQHVECVGIKSNCVPETYLCDECDPRPLDKERAKQIQSKKIEEHTDEEDEEDGDVSDHDSDNMITRVSIPNSASIKENILTKGKRKKRDSARKLGQKEIKHNKRKRRKRKHITSEAIPVDENTNGPWSLSPFPGGAYNHEQYQQAQKTVYIGELDKQTFPASESQPILPSFIKPEQLCKVVEVQKNKKGVVMTEDTSEQQFIIECKGNLMLESKFKEDNPMFPKSCPFILNYTKLDHLRLVMNLGKYGNDARFIRRSCSPTGEVRHVIVEGQIHLVIVSVTPLAKGSEVTVAFEFPFHEYRRQLECACAQDNCKVLKHNLAIQSVEQTNGYRSKDEHGLSLMESSLSNHMDSDSDGDNSNEAKDKRSRKKLSREERKIQQYLKQIEKMEKTAKKRQQSNGRDARTGILTQRNFGDEFNVETPSKPGKTLRKQGISQKQRKTQSIIRRTHRLPSCSSEPLSPEDNYSSAASTPTTPSVNVAEEHNEVHRETPDKSFKFPKFKKGSLNDITTSNSDIPRSNNASPEATSASPSKSSFEARLVEIEATDSVSNNCEGLSGLEQTVRDCSSPRTDPNFSPSPCHSTSASPTRSESVDLPDVTSRHCTAAPLVGSIASYLLNEKQHKSSFCHTTLKKRWLLKYMSEPSEETRLKETVSMNGNFIKPVGTSRITSPRTFPLPYKRRKLLEYQNSVNHSSTLSRTNVADSRSGVSDSTILPQFAASSSSITPGRSNSVTSVLTIDVRNSCSQNSSQNSSPILRNNVGCDDSSSGRSSFSSVSLTEDIKTYSMSAETKTEENANGVVEESISSVSKSGPSDRLQSVVQGLRTNSLDAAKNCVTRDDEGTTKVTTTHAGSSVEGGGPTTPTTAGGKKKVSLSDYRNRKRTSIPSLKKESGPVHSSEVSPPSLLRVSESTSVASSTDPLSSSTGNYRISLGSSLSNTTCSYGNTLLSSSVTGSTGGVLIEPVSPVEAYRADDDRRVLHTTSPDVRNTTLLREAKPSVTRESYFAPSLSRPGRPLPEPGSSSDAMDIEEDDAPSSSRIVINTPVMSSVPGTRPGLSQGLAVISLTKTYSPLHQGKLNNVSSTQPITVRQMNSDSLVTCDSLRRRLDLCQNSRMSHPSMQPLPPQDFRPAGGGPTPFH